MDRRRDMTARRRRMAGAIGGLPASSTFLARTSGLNAAHVNAYTALIDGLVTDGVWPLIDVLYLFATADSTTARLNLKSTSYTATVTGTPSFVADSGYTFSTSGDYLDSNYDPVLGGVNWTQNSAHAAGWGSKATSTIGPYFRLVGTGSNVVELYPKYTDNVTYYTLNTVPDTATAANAAASSARFQCLSRTASNLTTLYQDAASISTTANVSQTMVDTGPSGQTTIRIGGIGTAEVYNGPMHFVSFGAALDATKEAALYNRVHTYLTAIAGLP